MFAFFSFDYFIASLICGGLCAFFANAKGRKPLSWFFIGFFFSFFAIVIVAFIRDKKVKAAE